MQREIHFAPPNCLSLDIEVDKNDGNIHAIAGVRADINQRLVFRGKKFVAALEKLDKLCEGASFILGHNVIAFDLPHLNAVKPNLRLLKFPVIDTLCLSPLAFPQNPYHHLVKHYQDGRLKQGQLNDPELDARIALEAFDDQRHALFNADPNLLTAWHWLTTPEPNGKDFALDELYSFLRGSRRPSGSEALTAINQRLADATCVTQRHKIMTRVGSKGWEMAYALAWLSVAGGNSVMPPWVRHQFPEAGRLVRRLRDNACNSSDCSWCREYHDAGKELKRWFGFPDFRPEPVDDKGQPMQRSIVEAAMAGKHVLGILPTGTGKSICYQIPALSRYNKTGALTVVISPLVALMADQVTGLEKQGISSCVTVNGLLSMPERADALDRVRLGDAGILIISPEQLRSRSVRRALNQREIGTWVLDEAHCLSRWGHDFRPDYRYVGRFIREKAGDEPIPPVLCLTATAKPDVKDDIVRYFRNQLDIELVTFDGGTERSNLIFEVIPTSESEKFDHIHQILMSYLPPDTLDGAIVYCATRRKSEEIAEFLRSKGVGTEHFHAGLPPETKKDVQQRFINGELRAIAATNAFGMGIDKSDVRVVIHADIPGSLENYLQEAGRAGRDRQSARCVLLYMPDDAERQFGMSARSRLSKNEIQGILKALRNLDNKKRRGGEVVATAGEILVEDDDKAFERDSVTDDTRVKTAVAWLEEAELLARNENLVQIFPSSLRVSTVDETRLKLEKATVALAYRKQLLDIVQALIEANADEGVSTDELMGLTGLSSEGIRNALYDLEGLGIANNDTALTAFVHVRAEHSSLKRLDRAVILEKALISHMRELAPDQNKGDTLPLHLRVASQSLRDDGLIDPLPERLWRIVRSIAQDGRGEDGSTGSMTVRKWDAETAGITLQREWPALEQTAEIRREAAVRLLDHLIDCLPSESRGVDLLAETTIGKLTQAIESDLLLKSKIRNPAKLLERALLWLHEQEVIRLNKGMAVFRPAMTIRLAKHRRREFTKTDFKPLSLHYEGQVLQIHVMVEFAERGIKTMSEALRLAMDYFTLNEERFLKRWLHSRVQNIDRETMPESWYAIVESLNNPIQQRIVTDDREQTNVLVLAGPGSGKTKALVHRIAYLIRAKRENPRGILALAYNRHAAVEIRRRLDDLVGPDARGITVLTCHALAMRLVGASFTGRVEQRDNEVFRDVIRRAVDLLKGKGFPPEEADEQRERLLTGFRWILVDEYQDIGSDQYELISALAGRTLDDKSSKLTIFAVGDDDQNIYAFNGTSVEFIRRFERDYGPKPIYLTDNYRSTKNIISAANAVIEPARERMKTGHPIHTNRARESDPLGGSWEKLDPVAQGRVQILQTRRDSDLQAQSAMNELLRLAGLSQNWNWSKCAVIARNWKYLDPVRSFCEMQEIPVQMANEELCSLWRMRETQELIKWLENLKAGFVTSVQLRAWADSFQSNTWVTILRQAIEEHALEAGDKETTAIKFIEWLAEWCREFRRQQRGLLLLTAHSSKGLEFDHVVVLDGGWDSVRRREDLDETRRLYYVAMTRAKETLTLMRFKGPHRLQDSLRNHPNVLRRTSDEVQSADEALKYRFVELTLENVFLGFAGRSPTSHPIHSAIASLSAGDPLQFQRKSGKRWELLNHKGIVVGLLAKNYDLPTGMRCRSAKVHAVVRWKKDVTDTEFSDRIKCDTWEVIIPELIFEPDT